MIGKAIVAALMVAFASAAHADVLTESGWVRGERADRVSSYKALPFAAPPVGQLRWRPPHPPSPWAGVREARRFASACMQTGVSMPGETPPRVSEDCLYLNVWTPNENAQSGAPVLVWIHGGSFTSGAASMPLYWGDRLARRGIVVVTISYRLGPLGFLAHPELSRESPQGSSGNYALMDQIAALEWVKRNISAFGGDPARVTIAGQSAGASSVSLLISSPRAKGLFRGAIAQSGGMFEPLQLAPNYQLANAERDGAAYVASLGADSIAALRALPAEALLKGRAGSVSHPVVEPDILPLTPYDAYAARQQNDVPLLVGANADEARSQIPARELDAVRAATFAADIEKRWGLLKLPPALFAAYPRTTDEEARRARLDFERDLRFGWDVWTWARFASREKGGAYFYSFRRAPPFTKGSVYENWGPAHFTDLWYMFDHLDQGPGDWTKADRQLANTMASYWVNFIKSGNPNGKGLPNWPRFSPERDSTLYLDEQIKVGPVPRLNGLEIFDATYTQIRVAPLP